MKYLTSPYDSLIARLQGRTTLFVAFVTAAVIVVVVWLVSFVIFTARNNFDPRPPDWLFLTAQWLTWIGLVPCLVGVVLMGEAGAATRPRRALAD